MRAEPVAPRTVAILVLPGAVPFDVGIAGQIFGDPMPRAGVRYRMLLCGLAPGLVTLAGGVPLGVQFGLDALSDAETIVVPGLNDVEAPVPAAALDALREAARR